MSVVLPLFLVKSPHETTLSNRIVEWRELPTPKRYDEPASSGARLSGVPSEPASWRSDSREGRCGGVGAFDRPVGLKLAFFGERNGRNETGHRTLTENLGTLCWPYVQTGCAGSIERMRDGHCEFVQHPGGSGRCRW